MGERWSKMAEKHVFCSSELSGPLWVSVSVQGTFIEHNTVYSEYHGDIAVLEIRYFEDARTYSACNTCYL